MGSKAPTPPPPGREPMIPPPPPPKKCACVSADARTCLQRRYPKPFDDEDEDERIEKCECACHYEDDPYEDLDL